MPDNPDTKSDWRPCPASKSPLLKQLALVENEWKMVLLPRLGNGIGMRLGGPKGEQKEVHSEPKFRKIRESELELLLSLTRQELS